MENLRYYTYEESLEPSQIKIKNFREIDETDNNAPFKNCVIVNDGNATIKVYINQGKHFIPIPSGTIKTLEDEKIESLAFENRSDTLTADFIYLLDNKFTVKELLKKIAGVEK